jgi:hypothetical protein
LSQNPQWAMLAVVSVSHPVFPVEQCAKPCAQFQPQLPNWQRGAPLTVEHVKPHVPQLVTFVAGSVHELPQHSVLAPVHERPHPMQLKPSLFSSTQRPLQQLVLPVQVPPTAAHASTQDPEGLHTWEAAVQAALGVQVTHWWRVRLQ